MSLSVDLFSSSSRFNFSTFSTVRPFANYCVWVIVKCSCQSVRPFPFFSNKQIPNTETSVYSDTISVKLGTDWA